MAFDLAIGPFREFMTTRVEPETIARLADSLPGREWTPGEEPSLGLLTSAFMLSEIKTAFQIGFAIFLPFLAIDLAVASVLMAMGMNDGAARRRVVAVQVGLLRTGGWLVEDHRSTAAGLRIMRTLP